MQVFKYDIRRCHIAVSKDHWLPEALQQAEGVVKEVSQCENWRHSRVRIRCSLKNKQKIKSVRCLYRFKWTRSAPQTGQRGENGWSLGTIFPSMVAVQQVSQCRLSLEKPDRDRTCLNTGAPHPISSPCTCLGEGI